jgi:hydrogenase maturation protease
MMTATKENSSKTWIIGLGNSQRRDDGLGPHVIKRLSDEFGIGNRGIILHSFSELDPNIIMDLRRAGLVLFVDATPTPLNNGVYWSEVDGWVEPLPYLSHHYSPDFVLGLLHRIYRCYPETWLVSIEGEDFEPGEGLTKYAVIRAERAVREITAFLSGKKIDRMDLSVNYNQDRSQQWATEKTFLS